MSLREPVYVCKELSRSRNRPVATFNDLPRNNGFDALLAAPVKEVNRDGRERNSARLAREVT